MFRNRRAKNSLPLPPGYVAVNNGHYRVPKKLTKVDFLVITLTTTYHVLRISLKTALIIIAIICTMFSDNRRARHTSRSARGIKGLTSEDFIDGGAYNKYRRDRKFKQWS